MSDASSKNDVLPGTLDLIVLKTLETLGPLHGYGITTRIRQVSEDLIKLNQGTLYPALLRLESGERTDASCLVISDLPSAGLPLSDVVDELLSQIHVPGVYELGGDVEVAALTVPAGPAERLRFTADRSGEEQGYVQYVLVNAEAGWLVGCDAPASDVEDLEIQFERMIATFRFTE